MSPRPHPSNEQDRSARGDEAPKRTGRLRSSCDSCHRSKIKCTGSTPCSACLGSQSNCTYSRGNRLGRPKGSKNKRTLMQESGAKQVEAQPETTKNSTDVVQWPSVDLASFDPGLDHAFGTVFSDDLGDGSLLLDPNTGVMETLSPKSKLDLQSLFTQNYSTFDPPNFLEYDSASGTDTVTTPLDYTTLPNSHGPLFGNTKPAAPASTTSDSLECSCLSQLIKLVYQLEDLRYSHASGPAIDAVLEGVKLAETPWKGLMQCAQCESRDTYKEAFLLFSMSIRILLASVQNLSSVFQSAATPSITVSIGTFSLTDDAKSEVIDMVIRKALQAIAIALIHLWERTGKPRPSMETDLGISNTTPLTQISLFTNTADEMQRLLGNDPISALSGAENTTSLPSTLQFLMKVTEEEMRTRTY